MTAQEMYSYLMDCRLIEVSGVDYSPECGLYTAETPFLPDVAGRYLHAAGCRVVNAERTGETTLVQFEYVGVSHASA